MHYICQNNSFHLDDFSNWLRHSVIQSEANGMCLSDDRIWYSLTGSSLLTLGFGAGHTMWIWCGPHNVDLVWATQCGFGAGHTMWIWCRPHNVDLVWATQCGFGVGHTMWIWCRPHNVDLVWATQCGFGAGHTMWIWCGPHNVVWLVALYLHWDLVKATQCDLTGKALLTLGFGAGNTIWFDWDFPWNSDTVISAMLWLRNKNTIMS